MTPGFDAVLNTAPVGDEVLFDLKLTAEGDIETADQLETAILVSLFTDQRAESWEAKRPQDRRGWIGDLERPDRPIGSKLWLVTEQARLTRSVMAAAVNYAELALAWMVSDGIAVSVSCDAFATETGFELRVTLTRPNGVGESFLVALWDGTR